MSTSKKTQSALRATLKQEDAALTERLPAAALMPAAEPTEKTPEVSADAAEPATATASMDAAVAAPEKVVKAKAPRPKAAPARAKVKPLPAKAATKPQPVTTSAVAAVATDAEPAAAAPAKKKSAPKSAHAAAAVAEPAVATKKGHARSAVADADGGKKEKPEKVVRDSFSMPANEHRRIKSLREKLGKAGRLASKSEVLRAGLNLLGERGTAELVAMLDALPTVAKGKRSKKH